jgi:uncharacterized protein
VRQFDPLARSPGEVLVQSSLALTALVMGLVGGPHCLAMCGSACAGIASTKSSGNARALLTFQLGRLLGYSALGALAASSMQALGWLSIHSASLRPVWTMVHVAAALMGLTLLLRARQPRWIESGARSIWNQTRNVSRALPNAAPALIGVLWVFLPCGLLYSALMVAGLTSNALDGALVMALFALGSCVSLVSGPWLWAKLRGYDSGPWATRLAGLSLLAISSWGLWMSIVHNTAPWCITNPSG